MRWLFVRLKQNSGPINAFVAQVMFDLAFWWWVWFRLRALFVWFTFIWWNVGFFTWNIVFICITNGGFVLNLGKIIWNFWLLNGIFLDALCSFFLFFLSLFLTVYFITRLFSYVEVVGNNLERIGCKVYHWFYGSKRKD